MLSVRMRSRTVSSVWLPMVALLVVGFSTACASMSTMATTSRSGHSGSPPRDLVGTWRVRAVQCVGKHRVLATPGTGAGLRLTRDGLAVRYDGTSSSRMQYVVGSGKIRFILPDGVSHDYVGYQSPAGLVISRVVDGIERASGVRYEVVGNTLSLAPGRCKISLTEGTVSRVKQLPPVSASGSRTPSR